MSLASAHASARYDFTGARVLVTGASRGIGLGVAQAFLEAGASVDVLADDEQVTAVARELSTQYGRPVAGLLCDITDPAQVAAAIDPLPRVDVLVNNAGLELITPIGEPDPQVEADFVRIININVLGTFHVTRRVLPLMPDGGRIVVTASMWGKTAVADFSAYCASKHANIGFVRSLAKELSPRRITVNAVCPGWVRTQASMRSLAAMAAREQRDEQALLDEIVSAQALPGLMEPEDVAGTYLFLASDAAASTTGQALTVDRGELLQ